MIQDDQREQIRSLEEHLTVAQATEAKQKDIETRLRNQYEKACKDLDASLQEAMRKKNEQVKEMYKIQAEVMQKRAENESTRLKSNELSHELDMLNNYTA
jgi:hypothetical protein